MIQLRTGGLFIYLTTEAISDSFGCIRAIKKISIYLSIYLVAQKTPGSFACRYEFSPKTQYVQYYFACITANMEVF